MTNALTALTLEMPTTAPVVEVIKAFAQPAVSLLVAALAAFLGYRYALRRFRKEKRLEFVRDEIMLCVVTAKFGPLMTFLKRWFAYTKTTFGGEHEYQEETVS